MTMLFSVQFTGYATRTMSDIDTRSVTPDQMNVDAIIQQVQSGTYLGRTLSTQSEGFPNGELTQSGVGQRGITQSGHFSDSLEQPEDLNHRAAMASDGDLGATGSSLYFTYYILHYNHMNYINSPYMSW